MLPAAIIILLPATPWSKTVSGNQHSLMILVATENSSSVSVNQNSNHQFNLRMEYYIDSMNSILYTPSVLSAF